MKTHIGCITATLAAAILQISCSTATGETSSPPGPADSEAVITLTGTNTQGLTAAPIALGTLEVAIDGRAIEGVSQPAAMDLAAADGVEARFALPANAETVRVTLQFDQYGGYETVEGTAGILDARAATVALDLSASSLAESGGATVAIDMGRSLVSDGATMHLAPNLTVTY